MPTPSIDELTNVSGIGPAAVEKFRDAGYETLADVADSTLDEITAVPGIGEATAQAILEYVTNEVDVVADEQDESAAEHDDDDDAQPSEPAAETDDEESLSDAGEEPADTVVEASSETTPASQDGAGETPVALSHEERLQQLSDALSPQHLRLLRVFHDPQKWAREHEQQYPQTSFLDLTTVLEHAVPDSGQNQSEYDQLWHDLYQHGLVTPDSLHVMTSRAGALSSRTSDLGNALLAYVDEQ